MDHSVALGRRPAPAAALPSTVSWPAVFCATTFVVWVIAPFLRRLVDWKTHFSAFSPFAALPLLMLVPAAAMFLSGRNRALDKRFELIALLWMLGFIYALVVAFLAGNYLGGTYTFVQFCLPLAFGLWIATRVEDSETWYRRISKTLIVLAVIAGVYGLFQYVVMPPWDREWMRSVQIIEFGLPEPFLVHVFSTLNSPATAAQFLTIATVMFLPRLTIRNAVLLLPIFAGIVLSLIRTTWVVLPFAIVVFALLTPRRKQVLTGVAAFVGVGILAILLSSLFGATIGAKIGSRFATLTNVSNDYSAQDRSRQMSDAFSQGLNDPEGQGLGVVGVGTKLNSVAASATTLDSGYMSRFVEMGFPGTIAFVVSLGIALRVAFGAWRQAVRAGDRRAQDIAGVAVAMQAMMLAFNIFGDWSNGLAALVAWTSLGLVLRVPTTKPALR